MVGQEDGADRDWWTARLDVDAGAPGGYRVDYLSGYPTVSRAHALEIADFQSRAAARDGGPPLRAPAEVSLVGRAGTYWIVFDRELSVPLDVSTAHGEPVRLTVRLTPPPPPPPARAPKPAATGPGRVPPPRSFRFARRELPGPMQAEGWAIGLCYALGWLFTIGGVKSWLDPDRWEAGRLLLLPAVLVWAGAYFWGKNWRARAYAHLLHRSGR